MQESSKITFNHPSFCKKFTKKNIITGYYFYKNDYIILIYRYFYHSYIPTIFLQ